MATDPSISLSYKFPTLQDPVQEYSRMVSLRGMQQKQQQDAQLAPLIYQEQAAAAQRAQLQAQQAAQAQKDIDIWTQAYKDSGGDLEQAQTAATANGASMGSMMKFQNWHDTTIANAAKNWTEEKKQQAVRNDMLLPRMQAFRKKSPEDQQAQWTNWLDQAHQDGAMTDEDYFATKNAHPDKPPTSDQWDDYVASKTTQSYIDKRADVAATQRIQQTNANIRMQQQNMLNQSRQEAVDEKKKTALLEKARGATDLDEYNQTLLDAGVPMDYFGKPPFDPATKEPVPEGMVRLNRLGMNPAQVAADDRAAVTAKETAARDANTRQHQAQVIDQGERRLNQGDERINIQRTNSNRPRASDEKSAAAAIANKYFAENNGDLDKSIAAIANSQDPADKKQAIQATEILTKLKNDANRGSNKKGEFSAMDEMAWMRKNPTTPMPKTRDAYNQAMGIKAPAVTQAAPPAGAPNPSQQPVKPPAQAQQPPAATPPVQQPPAAKPPAAVPPATPGKKVTKFRINGIPPEIAAHFGGKTSLEFPSEEAARQFAAKAGLKLQ